MFLKTVDHSETVEMQAFLVLDEHAVSGKSLEDGDILEYTSGKVSQVSIGDTLVRVYPGESSSSAVEKIYALREKIEFCKKVSDYAARQGVDQIKKQIEKYEKDISAENDLDRKEELRYEYKALLAAYSAKMDSSFDYQSLIKGYESEINAAYASLGKEKAKYISDVNGAYFSECDGYEGMISQDMVTSGDLDSLYGALSEKKQSESIGELGKVVDMNTWRLACMTDRDTALHIVAGQSFKVTLGSSDKVCTLTAERVVSERGRKEAVVVFKSSLMLECDDYSHFQTVSVALNTLSGYRIPTGAVRYENGVSGVYVLRGSIVRYRQIEIIGAGDGYVIASQSVSEVAEGFSALNRYDRVIVRGHDLYDRKVII